ncbi:hypothetical protein B0H10DRAFT_2137028 [Mycena sp. CBHHK59/15]|nr:hypothetical protein B0H10DRAFT_2137028 [Mycena sp. CBHHK59/15]
MPPQQLVCCPFVDTFNSTLERSLLSIDWVLTRAYPLSNPFSSDSVFCLGFSPFDLVLGRDWLVHCTNSVPDACFYLSSGLVNLASFAPALCSSTHSPTMDIDGPEPRGIGAEASSSRDTLPILRDIFLGHHATRSRISIFHSDLPTIKTALELSIPSHNITMQIHCTHTLSRQRQQQVQHDLPYLHRTTQSSTKVTVTRGLRRSPGCP